MLYSYFLNILHLFFEHFPFDVPFIRFLLKHKKYIVGLVFGKETKNTKLYSATAQP